MWVHKSYTDLSAIDKALNMMCNCLLDFDSTPRPPQKTKRQDTKNAGIRISVNGLLAFILTWESPQIFGRTFVKTKGKTWYFFRKMCFFCFVVWWCHHLREAKSFKLFPNILGKPLVLLFHLEGFSGFLKPEPWWTLSRLSRFWCFYWENFGGVSTNQTPIWDEWKNANRNIVEVPHFYRLKKIMDNLRNPGRTRVMTAVSTVFWWFSGV